MSTTAETMQMAWSNLQNSRAQGLPVELRKAITQSTGLVWYDLEPYAKLLFPVITPLRNEIPRVAGDGGTATHWKSITAINSTNVSIGLGEGQRGGTITTVEQDNVATFKTYGLDDSVTWQADLAAKNFDDVKKLAVDNLLRAVMIGEEICIIGGNSTTPLGTTPTPTLSQATTGGSLVDATYSVICVALTLDGYRNGTVAAGIPTSTTRTNTDTSTLTYGGGSARKSAAASIVVNGGGATEVVKASIADVPGAVAYAWFWGAAGSELLGAITTINSYVITATATGTQTATSLGTADNSTNTYLFDGLIPIAANLNSTANTGTGAYYKALATGTVGTGTPLTADGAGGIVEIDTALKAFWDNYKLSPQVMLVNSQELVNITNKVIAGGAAPLFRYVMDNNQGGSNANQMSVTAGTVVGTYLNKFTMAGGQLVQVLLHPNIPPGTIIFYSRKLNYPLSNVANLLQMKMRRDYFQIEWPQVKPAYEYSVWADGVLQCFFTPAFGMIRNIGNG